MSKPESREPLIERLRKKNRTVLEMDLGILALGAAAQIVFGVFSEKKLICALSLLAGTLLALLAVRHMYRTLDRALDLGEGGAQKLIFQGYLTRYLVLAAVLLFVIGTRTLDPLLLFLTYMSLKGTAYLQPLTHKICNRFFHESDPIPQPLEEERDGGNL